MTTHKETNIDFAIKDQDHLYPPKSSIPFDNFPTRLLLNGKFFEIKVHNEYAKLIFRALILGLKCEWFQGLNKFTQTQYSTHLIKFIKWVEQTKINDADIYLILKDYEVHQVNILGLKPQSTGLNCLINLIKKGVAEIEYESGLHPYIELLILRTVLSKNEPPVPETLTNFFGSITWLRKAIGNEDYLKLESPKRLSNSFSVTIATMLIYILKIKKVARNALNNFELSSESDTLDKRVLNCTQN